MANEDPAGIPEQIRQNRPFMIVLALAFLVAIGTYLYILSLDPNKNDLERTEPPAALVTPPAASAPSASGATATTAPAASTAPATAPAATPAAPASPAPAAAPAAPSTN